MKNFSARVVGWFRARWGHGSHLSQPKSIFPFLFLGVSGLIGLLCYIPYASQKEDPSTRIHLESRLAEFEKATPERKNELRRNIVSLIDSGKVNKLAVRGCLRLAAECMSYAVWAALEAEKGLSDQTPKKQLQKPLGTLDILEYSKVPVERLYDEVEFWLQKSADLVGRSSPWLLALIEFRKGDLAIARGRLDQAKEIYLRLGPILSVQGRKKIAEYLCDQGNIEGALEVYQSALSTLNVSVLPEYASDIENLKISIEEAIETLGQIREIE